MKTIICGALCAILILLAVSLGACGVSEPSALSFQAMDTLMTLKVYGGGSDICDKLRDRVEELDSLLSTTDENSDIYRLDHEKSLTVSEDTACLLRRSLALCGQLGGSFDITVYPAVQAWGFTTGSYRVPDDSELDALSKKIDCTCVAIDDSGNVSLPDGVMIDLGAVAKGYAADVCTELLSDSGAQAAVLNLGGTICLYGKKPDGSRFSVGVADPDHPADYFGYLSCDTGVAATSGGYERWFEQDGRRYIHILDPKTARPVDNGVLSVTVVSESGTEADALSTALFVMGTDKAAAYYRQAGGFEYIILTEDDTLYITEGIYDDFTLADGYDFTVSEIS